MEMVFLMTAGLMLGIVTLLWFAISQHSKLNLPPGPPPFPVVGNLPQLARGDVLQTLAHMRSEYGDLFTLRLGSRYAIFVNGYDTMKELLVKRCDDTSERPSDFLFKEVMGSKGVVGSSGSIWKAHRTSAVTTLRNFGFGKRNMEDRIVEELKLFLQEIESKNGKCFDLDGIIGISIANTICSLAFGHRYEYSDERFAKLIGLFKENVRVIGPSALISIFPFLKYVPGDPCKGKQVLKNIEDILAFLGELVKEHKETYDEEYIRDFIDAYLMTMEHNSSTFTDEQLTRTLFDLFAGGTETTATCIKWGILYFLHYPDVQNKMKRELDDVVGLSRPPCLSDRSNLPYCEAVVTEILRCSNIVPLSLQHSCRQDIRFKGYVIPKNVTIIPNLDSVHSDSDIFENPECFKPERFIDVDGKLHGQEKVIPFSIGPRTCIGESFARLELFLYLSSMVQQFRFVPKDKSCLPRKDGILGLTRMPHPYKVRALKRM